MIQGVPSRPGSQRGACEERWAVWKRGCGVYVPVCVFLGLREECGEVGRGWRAGRVESRTFLAVELGGGHS